MKLTILLAKKLLRTKKKNKKAHEKEEKEHQKSEALKKNNPVFSIKKIKSKPFISATADLFEASEKPL